MTGCYTILGTLFGLLLGLYGAVRRQPEVVRAALLAFLVSGVGSAVALRTGEGAEEAVEHLPGVSERLIHEHEEAAESANIGAIALALVVLGVLAWRRRESEVGTAPTATVLLLAAVVFALMARAGDLGGEIRHTEIRDGAAAALGGEGDRDAAEPRERRRDDDKEIWPPS